MIRPGSQNARVLAVLADGKSHGVPEIHRRAGTMRLNSRVAELRKHGYAIVCQHTPGVKGARGYHYTWTNAPALAPEEEVFTITAEEYAPRNERERFRIYRATKDATLELVATCGSPEAVGVALCTLGAEAEFHDCTVGVMDTNGTNDKSGTWLVNPFDGRT